VIIDVYKAGAYGHMVGVPVTDPATGNMTQAAASDRATAEQFARNVLAAGEQHPELSLVVCVQRNDSFLSNRPASDRNHAEIVVARTALRRP
jgi:hypothetical protein